MPDHGFGWADDSIGPIDTTPANIPQPPDTLVNAAAWAIPAILENVDPSQNFGEVSAIASELIAALIKEGHTARAADWAVHRLVVEGMLLAKPAYDANPTVIASIGPGAISGSKTGIRQTTEVGGGYSVRPIPEGKPAPPRTFRVVATDTLWSWWRSPSAVQAVEDHTSDADPELLYACGLPAEPTADVRELFDMAVRVLQRNDGFRCDAAAAAALAEAIARAGGQNVRTLPFGHGGSRAEQKAWLRRNDLTCWLTQLGGLVAARQFNADSARMAIGWAVQECWLRVEQIDEWQPGMASGSGLTDLVQAQAVGIARAAQMAPAPAARQFPVKPIPAPVMPYRVAAQAPAGDTVDESGNSPEVQPAEVSHRLQKPKRSTERGEGRAKLIAALTMHHQYAHDGCLNLEPIGNNELARLANVSDSTASAFFNKEFDGHTKYRWLCGDAQLLVGSLKLLNQEYSPRDLSKGRLPGEGVRDDDE